MASPVAAPLALYPPPRGFADTCEDPAPPASGEGVAPPAVSFDALYDEHFELVYRSFRRLGVQETAIDDAVQEVFLVVHRRLAAFEGRSSPKTWLFGIVLHVARTFRRAAKRHPSADALMTENDDPMATPSEPLPDEQAERAEAVRALQEILDAFTEDKREVFVLAELEQMTAPEIAEVLGIPLTSVYARLRAARHDFEQALVRRRARDAWRQRGNLSVVKPARSSMRRAPRTFPRPRIRSESATSFMRGSASGSRPAPPLRSRRSRRPPRRRAPPSWAPPRRSVRGFCRAQPWAR